MRCINCFNYSSSMPLLLKMHSRPRIRLRHFARWNTNPFKLEALDGFDPHTLPPSLPPCLLLLLTLQTQTSGGIHNAAITFITSTFTTRTCSLQCLPPSGHVGVRQKWPDAQPAFSFWRPPPRLFLPTFPPSRRWEVWDCAVSRGSSSSTASYLMVFEDASGFLPQLLPTFLHAGAIFNRYIPCRPFFRAPASRRRTHCVRNPLQSIPQWYFVGGFPQMQLFLSFFFLSLL